MSFHTETPVNHHATTLLEEALQTAIYESGTGPNDVLGPWFFQRKGSVRRIILRLSPSRLYPGHDGLAPPGARRGFNSQIRVDKSFIRTQSRCVNI